MADTQTQQQETLEQFCRGYVAKRDAGSKLSFDEVITEAITYTPVQEYFSTHTKELAQLFASPEEESLRLLHSLFSDPRIFLPASMSGTETLTQFPQYAETMTSLPAEPASPIREQAINTLIEQQRQVVAQSVLKRRTITREFFLQYQKRIFQWSSEQTEDAKNKIKEQVQQLEKESTLKNFEEMRADAVEFARQQGKEQEIVTLIEQYAPEMNVLDTQQENARGVVNIVLENPNVTNPAIIAKALERGDDAETAARIERMATVVEHPVQNAHEVPASNTPGPAFAAAWANTTGKDAVFEQKAPDGNIQKLSFTEEMARRLGSDVAESEQFKKFIRRGDTIATQQQGSPGAPDQDMLHYIEVLFNKSADATPNPMEYMVGKAYASHPQHFHFEMGESPLNWIFQWGAKKEAGAATTKTLLSAGGRAGVKNVGASFLAKLGLGRIAGILGGPVGWALVLGDVALKGVGAVVNKIASGGILGIGTVANAFGGYMKGAVNAYGRQKDPLAMTGWLAPALLVGAVFLIPFSATWNTTQIRKSAGLPIGIGNSGGPTIDCAATPDIPECQLTQCEGDCAWPVDVSTHACIFEGPFVGTHSSCHLSGIDLIGGSGGSLFGATVYTPYAGVVEEAIFGYNDNSGYAGNQDGGAYGNFVRVATENGGHLLFAHLRNIQTVQKNQRVEAKTVVGFVDHTGYSEGPHLHYEDWSGGCPRPAGDINKFLPFPVPPCEGTADCDAKLKASGHAACL